MCKALDLFKYAAMQCVAQGLSYLQSNLWMCVQRAILKSKFETFECIKLQADSGKECVLHTVSAFSLRKLLEVNITARIF